MTTQHRNTALALPDAPVPDPAAVIAGERWRIQVLTSRLMRIEWSPSGSFEDRATQMVVNRALDAPAPASLHVERGVGGGVRITTDAMTLDYDGAEFSPAGLVATVRRSRQWGAEWRWGPARESTDPLYRNLRGTARTLDEVDGRCDLEPGIMDGRGITALEDTTLPMGEDGRFEPREDGAHDLYVFAYGRDFRGAIADFYRLTGPQPILPRHALGNWWSRFHRYSDADYRSLLDDFDAHGVPLSVAVLDMDWHLVDIDPDLGSGWTGFTWNRDLFPDPSAFAADVHRRGLALTLNLHPADGIRAHEDAYPGLAARFGIDPATRRPVRFDATDPEFIDAYLSDVLAPLEDDGVDFWWVDWQQGASTSVRGLDPLWVLNHVHVLDNARRHGGRGLTLSRYAGPGSHRYPVGFSGDTTISWASLAFQPEFTATAANIGYGWWSHDIGGHMGGVYDVELATRWVQFGVFSPIMRLHSTVSEFARKEPWTFPAREEGIQERFLRLRHRLVPYLHSEQVRGHEDLWPLIQPMYWEDPEHVEAFRVPNQYMFGRSMTVAPITSPADPTTGLGAAKAWLPDGEWADLFTGLGYAGGRERLLHRPLETLPVLARRGAVLPLAGRWYEAGAVPSGVDLPEILELLVVAGASGEYELIEDEGVRGGRVARTILAWDQGTATLRIGAAEGDGDLVPGERTWRVTILGAGDPAFAGVEGAEVSATSWDAERGAFVVDLAPTSTDRPITVRFSGVDAGDAVGRQERCLRLLADTQMSNPAREALWNELREADPARALVALAAPEVPDALRAALAEIIGAG
ncbi:glycosyl hydrolase family 31 [Schaalia cardiffensis]|uniref:glycoside hydrolase family 31 protein n=1 Tax=Schaalia cardiffensis TaxID=181487 RepID=UPI0018E81360|nr:glycoside hydrolase family 31 protein [Schaalia cardiffensis]MBJ2329920.1 glycosyl hydrolase family 31 [Schaalia cardiffensis]